MLTGSASLELTTQVKESLAGRSLRVCHEITYTLMTDPKVYFTDLGIRNSLLNLTSISQIERLGQMGMAIENMMLERAGNVFI